MSFHITNDSLIGQCEYERCECPVASSSQHFISPQAAAYYLVDREAKCASSYFGELNSNWEHVHRDELYQNYLALFE